jgi:uncharacterized protein (DUF934 family)
MTAGKTLTAQPSDAITALADARHSTLRLVDPASDPWHGPAGEDGPPVKLTPRSHLRLDLAQWHALRASWRVGVAVGLRVGNDVDPALLAGDLAHVGLIELSFPKWTDGRAYSQAHLLRHRWGYRGELRAVGEVLVDMLPFLVRVGFDAAVLRADQSRGTAERAMRFFEGHYQ